MSLFLFLDMHFEFILATSVSPPPNPACYTDRCWTKYSTGYFSISPLNKIPMLRAGITKFAVQMAISGIANRF
jgi:hypothetical protein